MNATALQSIYASGGFGDPITPVITIMGQAIAVDDSDWEEAAIPVRAWLAKGYLLRGAVTVVSGPGSAGKSSLMVSWCIAMALAAEFAGFKPVGSLKVLTYNVEDDAIEQRRRMSAALRHFGATPSQLQKRVVRLTPAGVGTLLRRDPITGRLTFTEAMTAIEREIEERMPDVLILDPLVELHDAEENDNTAIRAVMAKFRSLAAQYNIAVVLLHHSRKGSSATPGDPDTLRGASAIVGAARVVLTLSVMTSEEAGAFGLPEAHRFHYVRLDGAKSNYAPLHEAEWFERVAYDLDNGETVAACIPWEPPSKVLTAEVINTIIGIIERGTAHALPWSDRISDSEPRSISRALEVKGIEISSKAAQREAMKQVMATGRVVVAVYQRTGRSAAEGPKGLRSEGGLPSCVEWLS